MQQSILHNDLYLDETGARNFRDILKANYNYHSQCDGCNLISLCPGFLKDYLAIYPDFTLKTPGKKPDIVLKNARQKLT